MMNGSIIMKGFIYEPQGFDQAKFRAVQKIKNERGARLGRYIMASTTAKYNEPSSIFDIPCDLAFPCSSRGSLTEGDITLLATNGCQGIIEGIQQSMTNEAITATKKRG